MYFKLTNALKRRMILELRKYWQYHPAYTDLAENIQGKFSFKERPSFGIIVKTNGGTRVDLAADNYIGIVESYCFLAKVANHPGGAVEWVREDAAAIQANGGVFPTPAGVYYIDLTENTTFYVDSLIDARHELVTMTDNLTGFLRYPPLKGTLRLYERPSNFLLVEDINYSLTLDAAGKPTGEILLRDPLTGGRVLSADYRWPGATTGPHEIAPNFANNKAIPGVVLAFGRKNKKGDRLAVVVQNARHPAALEYGGRWDITLDFDVMSRDVDAQQEIADQTVVYLWGVLRSQLSSEGMEMTDLSLGGESEEIYDENGDDYYYNSAFSMTVQTDWSIHVPLALFLRQVSPLSLAQSRVLAALPDDRLGEVQSNIAMVADIGLLAVTDPFFSGKSNTFESIK